MNRFIGYIQVACCCLLLCASCVRDGMDEDCNSYVRFVYDYNLEYIDLFHKQATKMNLYVFDEKGVFVTELKEESGLPDDFTRSHGRQKIYFCGLVGVV